MEDLFKELSKFARENHKALKPAEQWLNKFDDGDVENVWISAYQPFDWRKIVFIAWLASDEKIYECKLEIDGFNLRQWCGCDRNKGSQTPQNDFLHDVILQVGHSYTTKKPPSLYLIRSALEEGKKAVNGMELKWQVDAPDFMFLTEAIKKIAEGKISVSTMSRSLTPDNSMSIRYMRKARRCKVHIGDFMRYIKEQKTNDSDQFTDEAFRVYFEGAEKRKEKIRQEKTR